MTGLSNIFGKENAEGANAPSASSCSCACNGSEIERDPSLDLPDFGYPQKLALLRQQDEEAPIDGYVLFGSHTEALALFDAAKKEGHGVRISPTPRAARSSCGIALLTPCDEVMDVFRIAQGKGIIVENLVALPRQINANRDRYC